MGDVFAFIGIATMVVLAMIGLLTILASLSTWMSKL